MTTSILDGIRASGHVYSLFQHFLMTIDVINADTMEALPVQALAMIRIWVQYLFSFVFVFNGMTSGKWLTLNLSKDRSDLRVSIKFLFDRLSMIAPLAYLYLVTFGFVLFFLLKEPFVEALGRNFFNVMQTDVLFLTNYLSTGKTVITSPKIPLICRLLMSSLGQKREKGNYTKQEIY